MEPAEVGDVEVEAADLLLLLADRTCGEGAARASRCRLKSIEIAWGPRVQRANKVPESGQALDVHSEQVDHRCRARAVDPPYRRASTIALVFRQIRAGRDRSTFARSRPKRIVKLVPSLLELSPKFAEAVPKLVETGPSGSTTA